MGDNLISSAIPNIINGVSQQPATQRLSSQCELQENAYATVVNGLEKRPPTQTVAMLIAGAISNPLIHTINRSATERYKVVLTNGDLAVFGIDGVAKSVSFPQGKGYLAAANPLATMKALTIADYTFVINTSQVVAMSGALSPNNQSQALVFVKQGQYSCTYTIRVDGVPVSAYVTSGTTISDIQTDNIANQLAKVFGLTRPYVTNASYTAASHALTQVGQFAAYTWAAGDRITLTGGALPGSYEILAKVSADTITLAAHPTSFIPLGVGYDRANGISGPVPAADARQLYDVSCTGSAVLITKKDGTKIDCTVEDTFGNRAISLATSEVQNLTDLPLIAPNGFVTKVLGGNGNPDDDYYVKFVSTTSTGLFGPGNWHETVGPMVHTSFDASTMPWVLVRNVDGTFTFQQATWGNRNVGDETLVPNPSFVGQTITDAMLFENRLGFISKDNTILSEAGRFFNFWATTVTTLLDGDPIDVTSTASPASGVATLKAGVPFQSKLILFSDHSQFVLSGGDLLTAKTVSIHETTEFTSDLAKARPIISGKNIFFPFKRGSFSGVQEYFVDLVSNNYDAAEATKHVPRYIPGGIIKLTSAPNEDIVVALADGDQSSLYVYKYYWNNNQKLQSCWSRWTFDGSTILDAEFIDLNLHIISQRTDGVYMDVLSIDQGSLDAGLTYTTLLDRRITNTQCLACTYSAITGLTTWTLPYVITGTMVAVTRTGATVTGRVIPLAGINGATQVTAAGDYHLTPVYLGNTYKKKYRFSKPQLHEQQQGGTAGVIASGRIQLRSWSVLYDSTAYFKAIVTAEGRDVATYVFSGRTLGNATDLLGRVNLKTGTFKIPVFSKADRVTIDIENGSPFPSRLMSAEFEALYVIHTSRF